MIITDSNHDCYAGALIALIGAGAAYQGSQYGVGSLMQMESGVFPGGSGNRHVILLQALARFGRVRPQTTIPSAAFDPH